MPGQLVVFQFAPQTILVLKEFGSRVAALGKAVIERRFSRLKAGRKSARSGPRETTTYTLS